MSHGPRILDIVPKETEDESVERRGDEDKSHNIKVGFAKRRVWPPGILEILSIVRGGERMRGSCSQFTTRATQIAVEWAEALEDYVHLGLVNKL